MVIVAVFLGEDLVNAKEVAENAHAALGGFGVVGDGGDIVVSLADGAEDIELDGSLDGSGSLVGLDHVKDKAGVGGGCCRGMLGHR